MKPDAVFVYICAGNATWFVVDVVAAFGGCAGPGGGTYVGMA